MAPNPMNLYNKKRWRPLRFLTSAPGPEIVYLWGVNGPPPTGKGRGGEAPPPFPVTISGPEALLHNPRWVLYGSASQHGAPKVAIACNRETITPTIAPTIARSSRSVTIMQ